MGKNIVLFSAVFLVFILSGDLSAQYSGDCKNGQGTLIMQDGRRYEGRWKDGQPHEEGTMTNPNGKTEKGIWKAGKYITVGK